MTTPILTTPQQSNVVAPEDAMDLFNVIFMDLPDSTLTRQVLPVFEQLFIHLVSHAPHQPDLVGIENCFKVFSLSKEILDIINDWQDPLYGHKLSCYIRFLYPSAQVSSKLPIRAFVPKQQQQQRHGRIGGGVAAGGVVAPTIQICSQNSHHAHQQPPITNGNHSDHHQQQQQHPPTPIAIAGAPTTLHLPTSLPPSTPITPMTPIDQHEVVSNNHVIEAPRESIINIFTKHHCPCDHHDCDFKTVLHSFLSTIKFSPRVSRSLSSDAFDLVSENFLNYFDTVDDISPIMLAIDNKHTPKIVQNLLKTKKCNVNLPSAALHYPIQHAIQRGESDGALKMVRLLIEHKADLILPKAPSSEQPLSLAINTRADAMGEVLVKAGAPVNGIYSYNQTMVQAAIAQHMTGTAIALLDAKAEVSIKPGQDGGTILHHAAQTNNSDIVERLLKMKIDVDTKNAMGQSPLEVLMQQGTSNGSVIRTLILSKANPNVVHNNVPLMCQALFRHNYDQIRSLLAAAHDLEMIDPSIKLPQVKEGKGGGASPSSLSPKNRSPPQPTPQPEKPAKVSWFRSIFGGGGDKSATTAKKPTQQQQQQQQQQQKEQPLILYPNINMPCPRPIYQGTLFLYACHSAPQDIVEVMVKYFGVNLFKKNENKATCIHISVTRDDNITRLQREHFESQNDWIQGRIGLSLDTIYAKQTQHQQQQQQLQERLSQSAQPLSSHSSTPGHTTTPPTGLIIPALSRQGSGATMSSRGSFHSVSHNGEYPSTDRNSFNSGTGAVDGTSPAIGGHGVQNRAARSPTGSGTRTRSNFGSFHSVNHGNSLLSSPILTGSSSGILTRASSGTVDVDPTRYEQNRLTLAKSFHIQSTTFDPFRLLSGFKLSQSSIRSIPTYDSTTATYSNSGLTPRGTEVSSQSGGSDGNHDQFGRLSNLTVSIGECGGVQLSPMPEAEAEDEMKTLPAEGLDFPTTVATMPTPVSTESETNSSSSSSINRLKQRQKNGQVVDWDNLQDEDEEVVFLVRLLMTVRNSFLDNTEHDFELV